MITMIQRLTPPRYLLVGYVPVRLIRDPNTGKALHQVYRGDTGEWAEDYEFVSASLMGVDPTADGFEYADDIEEMTKSEFDAYIDDLDQKRLHDKLIPT